MQLHLTCAICARPLAEVKTSKVVRVNKQLICGASACKTAAKGA
jgi:hypothetical protein